MTTRVAVVGAGPGGLLCALLAARAGFEVHCYEQSPKLTSRGNWMLGRGTVARLRNLGLELEGQECRNLRIFDQRRKLLFELPKADILSVRRQNLLDILHQAGQAHGVNFHFETHLRERPQADLIVGADGSHSRVRDWARLPAYTRCLGRYYRGEAPSDPNWQLPMEVWTDDGRRFGLEPTTDGIAFYCTAPACEPLTWNEFIETWPIEEIRQFFRTVDPSQVHTCRPLDVWCPVWERRNYALIGDAAHGQPPNLGQGANLAMADAFALVELWRTPKAPLASRCRRIFSIQLLHSVSTGSCWMSHWPHGIRDFVVRTLNRVTWLKSALRKAISFEYL